MAAGDVMPRWRLTRIAALAVLLAGPAMAQGLKGPPPPDPAQAPAAEPTRKSPPPQPAQPAAPDPPPRQTEPPGPDKQAAPQPPRRLDMQVVRVGGGPPVLVVQGVFGAGDAARFEQLLNATPGIREVLFNSPGGSVEEGLDIGRMIRGRKLATRLPAGAECDSICTMAFLGGVLRRIDTGAKYCVHMFASGDPELANRVTNLIKESGADATREVIELMQGTAARIAASWARYLIEMQVSLRLMTPTFRTRNRDVYCLDRDELRDFVVINVN